MKSKTTMMSGSQFTLIFRFYTYPTEVLLHWLMLAIPIVIGYSKVIVLHIECNYIYFRNKKDNILNYLKTYDNKSMVIASQSLEPAVCQ